MPVTREGCAWQDRMLPALVHRLAGGSATEGSPADLRRMVEALHAHLPGLGVESYLARKEPDGRIAFLRVT